MALRSVVASAAGLGRLLHVASALAALLDGRAPGRGLDADEGARGACPAQLARLVLEVDPGAVRSIVPAASHQIRRLPAIVGARAFINSIRRLVDIDDGVAVQDGSARWPGCYGCGATRYADERCGAQQSP